MRTTPFLLALTLSITAISAPQTSQPPATPTIQVFSRETIVDVLVTDAKGQPIRGLTKSDFTIKEDGKPQPMRSFGEFDIATTPPAHATPHFASSVHTNFQAAPTTGPVNVILVDALHSSWVAADRALQATAAYADRMPPGTQLAVFWLSVSGTHMLQGFTSNPSDLRDALAPTRTDIGSTGNCYQTSRLTIDALNQVAAYVATIKGRKNLLWFTPGMPVSLTRDGGYGSGAPSSCHESTVRSFASAAIAGLDNSFFNQNGSSINGFSNQGLFDQPGALLFMGDQEGIDMTMVHHLMDTYEVFTAEQIAVSPISSLGVVGLGTGNLLAEEVAEQSGGLAQYNNNDLTSRIDEAISAGSHYYTISYVPPRRKDDGHYHTINVEVADHPGLHLVYRKGYNAEDPRLPKPFSGPALIKAALQGRAPSATQLLFDAKLAPVPAATPPVSDSSEVFDPFRASAAPAPTPASTTTKRGKTSAVRTPYDLYIAIPQSQIAYAAGPNGTHTVKLKFAFDAYDLNGKLLGDHSQDVALDLTSDRYQRFIQKPVLFHALLMFYPGPLFLRVGVLDGVANKVGTLEIPLTVPRK